MKQKRVKLGQVKKIKCVIFEKSYKVDGLLAEERNHTHI
jgi:hypothetical protein